MLSCRWPARYSITDVKSSQLPNRPARFPPSTPATPEICLPNTRSETRVATVCMVSCKMYRDLAQFPNRCIRALASYTPGRQHVKYPRERRAAVLVALFVGRKGDLYVLLSRCVARRINRFYPLIVLQAGTYLTNLRRRYCPTGWESRRGGSERGRNGGTRSNVLLGRSLIIPQRREAFEEVPGFPVFSLFRL